MVQKLKVRSLGLLSKVLKWLFEFYLGILRYFEQLQMESLGYKFEKSPGGGEVITEPTAEELKAAYDRKLKDILFIIGLVFVYMILMYVMLFFKPVSG